MRYKIYKGLLDVFIIIIYFIFILFLLLIFREHVELIITKAGIFFNQDEKVIIKILLIILLLPGIFIFKAIDRLLNYKRSK
jgi:hypothetical protein